MHLSALRNAFETAAAVEIPKLLACAEALEEIIGSIDAAYIEGWAEALAEGDAERLRDLWQRRVMHHVPDGQAALAALKGAA
jgi:hypothetical protein